MLATGEGGRGVLQSTPLSDSLPMVRVQHHSNLKVCYGAKTRTDAEKQELTQKNICSQSAKHLLTQKNIADAEKTLTDAEKTRTDAEKTFVKCFSASVTDAEKTFA